MSRVRLLVALAVCAVATGAAAEEPPAGSGAAPASAEAPGPQGYAPPAVWGRDAIGRGSVLSLGEAVQIAVEKNVPLLSGRLNPRISEATIMAARATFDPTFALQPTWTWRERTTALAPPPTDERTFAPTASLSGTFPWSTQYQVSVSTSRASNRNTGSANRVEYTQSALLTLTQPLLKGYGYGIAHAPVDLAVLATEAARATFERLVESTINNVETLYLALAQAEENERVARESLERSEIVLKRNQDLYRLDLIPRIDLMTAEQNVAARAATLVNASRARQDAAESLLFYAFGEEAAARARTDPNYVRTSPLAEDRPTLPPVEEEVARVLETRRDVVAARKSRERSDLARRVARNALLPSLNLVGTKKVGGTALDYRWDYGRPGETQDDYWSAGVVFSIPLGNRSARSTYDQTVLDLEQRRLALVQAENTARTEVLAARRGVEANAARNGLAADAEDIAKRQYEMAVQSRDLGIIDTFRLLQYEETLSSAQSGAVTARFGLETALSAYRLSVGKTVERYFPGGLAPR